MKSLAAHRFHRIEALEVKASPAVEGLSAHTVPSAKVFHAHASRELSQDLLSDCIGASKFFHFLGTKKDALTAHSEPSGLRLRLIRY